MLIGGGWGPTLADVEGARASRFHCQDAQPLPLALTACTGSRKNCRKGHGQVGICGIKFSRKARLDRAKGFRVFAPVEYRYLVAHIPQGDHVVAEAPPRKITRIEKCFPSGARELKK